MADSQSQWRFRNQSSYPPSNFPLLPPPVTGHRHPSDFELPPAAPFEDFRRLTDNMHYDPIIHMNEMGRTPAAPFEDFGRLTDNMHYDPIIHRNEMGRTPLNPSQDYYQHMDEMGMIPVYPSNGYYQHRENHLATTGASGSRSGVSLPPDACNTLFVKGFPATFTKREASHIFRPFIGYKNLRLVPKGSRNADQAPAMLCYAEFYSATYAAIAKDILQGYKLDLKDSDSPHLELQFCRFGARPMGGHRRRP